MIGTENSRARAAKLRPAIVVMAKAPRAGQVKTRLVPPLTGEEAAALAALFMRDVIANVRRLPAKTILAYAPADEHAALAELLPAPEDLIFITQIGNDLGARLRNVCVEVAARGFSPFVIIGTDSPTLPTERIQGALNRLAGGDCDITLGATEDGGYYLVGLRAPAPEVFTNILWSSAQVYEQTLQQAAEFGLRVRELPRWYDVDEALDLQRLRDEFAASERARLIAPLTYEWMREHAARFNLSSA